MPIKPESVDQYLVSGCGRCKFGGTPQCKVNLWTKELASLRKILSATDLTEVIKWSAPCYTANGKNILMLAALKDCTILSFFRGAELPDLEHVLEMPGENSRFGRYMKFTSTKQIAARKQVIIDYVGAAVALEASGKKPAAVNDGLPPVPAELTEMFETSPAFRDAFFALTPGRQRGYLLHFTSAKQSKTRTARIEKCKPTIFEGKGWSEY
jgi:uncharacterized protein YdeI (YjbR/CyaY-like superfamily)